MILVTRLKKALTEVLGLPPRFPRSLKDWRYQVTGYPILVTSVPKAGTHLIKGLLDAVNLRRVNGTVEYYGWPAEDPNQHELSQVLSWVGQVRRRCYLLGHVAWEKNIETIVTRRRTKVLLMLRDPRDVVVSHVFHCLRLERSKFHAYYKSIKDPEERLRVTITGFESENPPLPAYWLPGIVGRFEMFLRWREYEDVLECRFEELVGERGGGSGAVQKAAVERILTFIDFPADASLTGKVAARLFSTGASTFRKGAVGGWQEHFTPGLKELFKERAQHLLEALGYEETDEW